MGRRPNQIVSGYFTRGLKVDDTSNRYNQTCRKCGELFLKGRVESLLGHLTRRCPNISDAERASLYHHIQGQQDIQSFQLPGESIEDRTPGVTLRGYGAASTLSVALHREHSALKTLAEASGKYMPYSSFRETSETNGIHGEEFVDLERLNDPPIGSQHQSSDPPKTADIDPSINQDVNSQTEKQYHQTSPDILIHDKVDTSVEQALLHELQLYTRGTSMADEAPDHTYKRVAEHPTLHSSSLTGFTASPLIQTAAAANRALETGSSTTDSSLPSWRPLSHVAQDAHEDMPLVGNVQKLNKDVSPNRIEDVATIHESGSPGSKRRIDPETSVRASKARGRFNDTRRKEVAELRRQGACLRCRMLKKSCSEGTPCVTCKNVDRARLWKVSCVRARLADEIDLWAKQLFTTRLNRQLDLLQQGKQSDVSGMVDINWSGQDMPKLRLEANKFVTLQDKSSIYLICINAMAARQVSSMVEEITQPLIQKESSTLLRSALLVAQSLMSSTSVHHSVKVGARASYPLQNYFLPKVLELWTCTTMLSTADLDNGIGVVYQGLSPRMASAESVQFDQYEPTMQNKSVIYIQILSLIEARARDLARAVLNELERRFLQRQHGSRLETFLVCLILLNCIERMTSVQQRYTEPTMLHSAATGSGKVVEASHRLPDAMPDASLGEPSADLLIMLMRMRALQPKTYINSAGVLRVQPLHAAPTSSNVPNADVNATERDYVDAVAAWLDPLDLDVKELQRIHDAPVPHTGADLEAWDLRYMVKVLLPQKI